MSKRLAQDLDDILTVIQCHASFLEDALEEGDARREDAAGVRRAAERGADVIRQLHTIPVIEAAAVDAVSAPRRLPPLDVLIVDDDPEVRAVADRILRDAGCRVVAAASAREARDICA